jgi:acetyltransferase-like isoleucine patch superfamily enzyme
MLIQGSEYLSHCIAQGWVEIGDKTVIEENVVLCHPTLSGERKKVIIGSHCLIRSGSVLYSGVQIGHQSQTGHHVVIRENTRIGNDSVIGTGGVIERDTQIGNDVLIQTLSYITAHVLIEDYVFIGPVCVTANDPHMLHRRAGARQHLNGPTFRWGCRIGAGVVILPGVAIGRESMASAGSVIRNDVPDFTLVGGNPARVIGPAPKEEKILEKPESHLDRFVFPPK